MRIVTARRVSQVFFVLLFFWFCVVATVGAEYWRLRGWPINWILSLDPLAAIGSTLSDGRLYAPLLWSLAAVALTAFVGRFFCGFACPMGALNQFLGWLGKRGKAKPGLVEANRMRRPQVLKYYFLVFFLIAAALGSLQIGLLDPLPLIFRSVNLTIVPLLDQGRGLMHDEPRFYASAWLIGGIFLAILGLNLVLPRFFCRFLCPLGALFGLLGRFSPWRIGKTSDRCGDCRICEEHCEGACRPSGKLVVSECVLCMNCLDRCPANRIGFKTKASAAGEVRLPDLSRRGLFTGVAAGALIAPLWGVGALTGTNRNPDLIRPPGALDEARFLARCLRCGQCMRACPTNVIQPALFEAGMEGLWTPILNNRIGRSGCQQNCIACGQVCPTAAIRPLTIEEKLGRGDFAAKGPVKLGTAFVDRTRCLPWVMDRPCIVCQELCPVSPKAIFTRVVHEVVRGGVATLLDAGEEGATLDAPLAAHLPLGSGDYFLRPANLGPLAESQQRRVIRAVKSGGGLALTLAKAPAWSTLPRPPRPGDRVEIVARLQRPFVDAARCIGCGMCEHECPISGLRGIRVTSENESRSGAGRMLL